MSECRALTNFAGNAVATVIIGSWTGGVDRAQLDRVLAGDDPFDKTTMVDDQVPLPRRPPTRPPMRAQTGRQPWCDPIDPGSRSTRGVPAPGVICDYRCRRGG